MNQLEKRARHARGRAATRQGQNILAQHQMIIGALVSLDRTMRGTLESVEVQACTDFIRERLEVCNSELQDLELSL